MSKPYLNKSRIKESPRGERHAQRYATGIFEEQPAADNPYSVEHLYCYGYDQLQLCEKLDFASYLYLLARGKLPDDTQAQLMSRALIAFSNPGVRHPATRAATTAAVGKTVAGSVLPVALLLMSSETDGADSIVRAMKFLRKASRKPPGTDIAEADDEFVFGLDAGSENLWLDKLCAMLSGVGSCESLEWGAACIRLRRERGERVGWLQSGLVAATFVDLGIRPGLAPGLLQLMAAPGLLVQGMEHANKETSVMPFVDDEHCEIER